MSTALQAQHVRDEIIIRMENVQKWYGTFQVLRNIDLKVRTGERIVICGPRDPASRP